MKIYKKVEEIANLNERRQVLEQEIKEDPEFVAKVTRIYWHTARFVTLSEEDKKAKNKIMHGLREYDNYYLHLYYRTSPEVIFGDIYFATDVPGRYVKVDCEVWTL